MLTHVARGDVIVASKLDRMFRSARDALNQAEDLHKQGVDIVLMDVSTDPVISSACGKLFFSMLASFAEFERMRIRERIAEGKTGKLARGGHAGGEAPYGWRIEGAGRLARLIEEPSEQAVIAKAQELRASGMGLNAISPGRWASRATYRDLARPLSRCKCGAGCGAIVANRVPPLIATGAKLAAPFADSRTRASATKSRVEGKHEPGR